MIRVEPDGITIKFSGGIVKVPFTELPKEVQQRFNYNPEKAAEYSANQNAALEQARKQQEQATRDRGRANGANKEQRPLQAWIRQTIHRSKDHCCRCRKGFCRRGVSAAPRTVQASVKGLSAEYYDQAKSHFYYVVGADAQARDRLLDLYALIMKDGE